MTSRTNSRCLIEDQPGTGETWSNFLVLVNTRAASDYTKKKLTPLPKPTSLSARFYCQNSTCVCCDCLALTKVDPARQTKLFVCDPAQDFEAKDVQKHAHNMLPLHAKRV